jgi:hypothetical protein
MYRLENMDQKKNLYVFSADAIFKSIFYPQLVKSVDVKLMDTEG